MFEAHVDLRARKVLSLNEVKGRQSSILVSEWIAAQEITKPTFPI